MTSLETEVLVIGSGAGGAVTAAILARAGRRVVVVEEGPWVDPDARGAVLARGDGGQVPPPRAVRARSARPPIAYAEGRCVGGSTEINSGLWHRLPARPRRRVAPRLPHRRVQPRDPRPLRRAASSASCRSHGCPARPPPSSAVLERGATKLGWRNVEFSRVFRYDANGRGVKQTMTRTLLPSALEAGASLIAGLQRDPAPDARATASSAPGAAGATPGRGRAPHHPRRPRLRVRGRHPDTGPAAAERDPRRYRRRAQAAPDDQDRRPLPATDRPRRRADAPDHRVRAQPHHRRFGQPAGPRRHGPRRVVGRLRATRSRTGSTCSCTTPPSAAMPAGGCWRCPGCGRRSSPTGSPRPT